MNEETQNQEQKAQEQWDALQPEPDTIEWYDKFFAEDAAANSAPRGEYNRERLRWLEEYNTERKEFGNDSGWLNILREQYVAHTESEVFLPDPPIIETEEEEAERRELAQKAERLEALHQWLTTEYVGSLKVSDTHRAAIIVGVLFFVETGKIPGEDDTAAELFTFATGQAKLAAPELLPDGN